MCRRVTAAESAAYVPDPQRAAAIDKQAPYLDTTRAVLWIKLNRSKAAGALIDRAEYVNDQTPCAETEAASELMKAALLLLELRAARRHGRVAPAFANLIASTLAQGCPKCGHIGCMGYCHEDPATEAA